MEWNVVEWSAVEWNEIDAKSCVINIKIYHFAH